MEIILNGDKQDLDSSGCANLAELVSVAGRSLAEPETFVLVGIDVDGQALPPEELVTLESRSLEGVQTVAIHERLALDVARSVLAQAADYTKQICEAIEGTVLQYRSGRSDLGGKLLAEVTDSMSILTGITVSVSNVLVKESSILAGVQAEIYPWLEELVEAQSVKDPIRIADTLEYEIATRIAEWGTTMRELLEGTHDQSPSTVSPRST